MEALIVSGKARIFDGLAGRKLQRNYSGPNRQRIIFFIIEWWTTAHFRGCLGQLKR